MRRPRLALVLAAGFTAALGVLAACGSSGDSSQDGGSGERPATEAGGSDLSAPEAGGGDANAGAEAAAPDATALDATCIKAGLSSDALVVNRIEVCIVAQ
jgi:hypothetical protein